MGGELLTRGDELWVMGSAIFSGMREEMELAKKLYMPIFYVSDEMRRDLSRIISAKYNRFMEHITNKAFSVSFPFLHR